MTIPMTIENIAQVFSIFHDGTIESATVGGSGVEMKIEIQYLANRIDKSFSSFDLELNGCEGFRFAPWCDQNEQKIDEITNFEEILRLDLEILSAKAAGTEVHVNCLAHSGHKSVSGGFLVFGATELLIFDESKRPISLPTLRSVCDGYWREREEESKKNSQQGLS